MRKKGLSRAIIGLNALTGSDFTAAFHKKGKVAPLNLLMNDSESDYIDAFIEMSEYPVSDMSKIMRFVCALYGFKNCSSINKARMNKLYKLAGRKPSGELANVNKVNCTMLPPCEKSLSMKVKRANLT